jgi:hypothetical protein
VRSAPQLYFQKKEDSMKKFLGVVVSAGAFTILVGGAVAQMEHGSGHDMHGAKGPMSKAGHHEMMANHMGKAGHHQMMKSQMGEAGHDMKSHMGKSGHDMKNHAGKPRHE